ncbi:hypothetical protein V8C43DRAFT_269702 [Trichoderma afarasin]
MRPITLQIDIENKEAIIPETGDDLISWTYTFDLARFVEAGHSCASEMEHRVLLP